MTAPDICVLQIRSKRVKHKSAGVPWDHRSVVGCPKRVASYVVIVFDYLPVLRRRRRKRFAAGYNQDMWKR